MRRDHRPYRLARAGVRFHAAWTRYVLAPQLDALGEGSIVVCPWRVQVHGARIRIGRFAYIVAARDAEVSLQTWSDPRHQGEIIFGDHCLVSPGVRLSSASRIEIGEGTMLARGAYLTDADWHDIVDRTQEVGRTAPIVLGRNVWIGDGAIITKGVTIGDNSVVGARAVVTRPVPSNVIVAGNPARVVREIGAEGEFRSLAALHDAPPEEIAARHRYLLSLALGDNSWRGWLRARLTHRD